VTETTRHARGRLARAVVLGAPRSGTTWLGEIINSSATVAYRYQPMHAYSFPLRTTVSATTQEIDEFFRALLETDDPYVTRLRSGAFGARVPDFVKKEPTHIVFKETHFPVECARMLEVTPDVKLIGIIRDPVACIESWYGVENEFAASSDIRTEWQAAPSRNSNLRGEVFGFDGWYLTVSTILRAQELFPERVEVVQYEKLVDSPMTSVSQLFTMLGLEVDDQTSHFLRESREKLDASPYGVYRQKDSQVGRRKLPSTVVAEIRRLTQEIGLERFLSDLAL
jgi:hypothetical protein